MKEEIYWCEVPSTGANNMNRGFHFHVCVHLCVCVRVCVSKNPEHRECLT